MVAPAQVADYYRVGDLFVSASASETQGLTYLEALACGLPALCLRDECLTGVVIDGVNGCQFRDGVEFCRFLNALRGMSTCAGSCLGVLWRQPGGSFPPGPLPGGL